MTVHTSGSAAVSLYATLGNIQPVAIGGGGGGGGTSPGSPDTSVQFNASGSFAGNAGLTYNNGLNALSLSGADNNPRLNIVNSAPTGTPAHYFVSAPESGRMVIGGINNSGNLNQIMQWSPSQSPADVLLETCNAGLTSCPYWQIDPTNGFRVTSASTSSDPLFQVEPIAGFASLGTSAPGVPQSGVFTQRGANGYVSLQGCDGTTAANCSQLSMRDDGVSGAAIQMVVPPAGHNPTFIVGDGLSPGQSLLQLDLNTGEFAVNSAADSTLGNLALNQSAHVFTVCNHLCAHKVSYDWTGDALQVTGTIDSDTNFVANGTPGKLSATTCTAFKFGLCTAGTDEPIVTRAEYDALAARLATLEARATTSATARSSDLWSAPKDLPLSARVTLSALALGLAIARLRPGRA
jgi:hypothetical protein